MQIRYTLHAKKKFTDLRAVGVRIERQQVSTILKSPDHTWEDEPPKKIAVGTFDAQHDLCIVYKKEHGIITVITFFPARKGRYMP